jgi:hypothetical protein
MIWAIKVRCPRLLDSSKISLFEKEAARLGTVTIIKTGEIEYLDSRLVSLMPL